MTGYRIKWLSDMKANHVAKLQRINADGMAESGTGKLVSLNDVGLLFQALGYCICKGLFLPSLAGTPSQYVPCTIEDGTGQILVQTGTDVTAALETTIKAFTFKATDAPSAQNAASVGTLQ